MLKATRGGASDTVVNEDSVVEWIRSGSLVSLRTHALTIAIGCAAPRITRRIPWLKATFSCGSSLRTPVVDILLESS